jgi:photosystem II stability/assembly factor-like uncharacterized protein
MHQPLSNSIKCVVFFLFFFTTPAAAQWISLNSGTTDNLRAVGFANVQVGYVLGENGVILKTTNAGNTWASLNSGTSHTLNGIHVFNPNTVIVCGNNGLVLRTTDGGASWAIVSSGTTVGLNAISFFDNSIGICAGHGGTLMWSTDGGNSWVIAREGWIDTHYGAHMVTSSVGYACGVSGIFAPFVSKTTNGGAEWDFYSFYIQNNEATLRDIHCLTSTECISVSFVWNGQGGISHTTDGGVSWTSQIVALGLLGVDFPASLTGYAVGINGTILKTTDRGVQWTTQSSGTSVHLWSVSFLDSLNGYVVGDNGTILKTTTGGVTSATLGEYFPQQFLLYQNYPNPFNPSTIISFHLPVATHVRLQVYNLLGQAVVTLVDEERQPGTYELNLDATELPSGVYFYRIVAGDFSETKKLILMR